ncbi:MAG: type VI secretion system tip protein TssI/VgrG [Sandaracinaceae bacterium]
MNQVEAIFFSEASVGVPWTVEGATVRSALNEPYVAIVDIQTELHGIDPLELLGSKASVTLRRGLTENVYGGIVSSVRIRHDHDEDPRARLVIEPALAVLRHGRDSRIFQEKSVPTILEEVLSEALAEYGREVVVEVERTYPKREYTVQYQESDFEFVHRLMEEEGILYRFEAGDDAERLVLFDASQQHPLIDGGLLEYADAVGGGGLIEQEYVRAFEPATRLTGTQVKTRHFDWTHPSVLIEGEASGDRPGDGPDGGSFGPTRESYQHDEQLTLHEYQLAYRAHDVTDQQQMRRDAQWRDARLFHAKSTVCAVRSGLRYALNGHVAVSLNAEYAIVRATHRIGAHALAHGAGNAQYYDNEMTVVLADVPYRPQRVRARPRVHGLQTAIVTGPPGEEIHTDEHGRVKVQFHWDRVGEMNEKTTCWIRCMQTWSGNAWGAFVLPRVGMEVVVSFIDGDLDRPLVTGCVYHGDNAVPYPLPEKKMVSTFKTNSYPGGDGYNELRFDDSKGEEEIWVHGEKDWNTVIENDLYRDVRHDETQNVVRNRTRTVGNDESVTVAKNRTKNVGVNETLNVGSNRSRSVGANESVMVGANRTAGVVEDEKTQIGKHRSVRVGLTHTLTAGVSLELRCGASRILMQSDGKISIEGTEFKFTASGDVFVAGSLIHLN